MDGRFNDNPLPSEPEIAPGSTTDLKTAQASLLKRSRRSVQKRVVSVPIADSSDGSRPRGAGEIAPPSDSWAWRKYGQKPIKGSPYPRGYYRCSNSKGCPARKQVERSHVDPNMLVVTYACEHNHHHSSSTPKPPPEEHAAPIRPDSDDKFADLVGDESAILMMPDDICWPSSTSPPAATEELLYTPFCSVEADAAMLCASEGEKLGGREGEEDEEDSLFADLGELPEYSVVFRRGYLERQMRIQVQGEEIRGYNLTATSTG